MCESEINNNEKYPIWDIGVPTKTGKGEGGNEL